MCFAACLVVIVLVAVVIVGGTPRLSRTSPLRTKGGAGGCPCKVTDMHPVLVVGEGVARSTVHSRCRVGRGFGIDDDIRPATRVVVNPIGAVGVGQAYRQGGV